MLKSINLLKLILSDNFIYAEDKRFYIGALLYFIDYMLKLPKDLTRKIREEIILNKEAKTMKYLDKNTPLYSWDELEEIRKEEIKREKAIEMAVEMLKVGLSLDLILKITKLRQDEIENLRKNL